MATRKKIPGIKRVSPTGSGSYGFDNGAVAFSDLTEVIKARDKRNKYYKDYNDLKRNKKPGKAEAKQAYHLKHG